MVPKHTPLKASTQGTMSSSPEQGCGLPDPQTLHLHWSLMYGQGEANSGSPPALRSQVPRQGPSLPSQQGPTPRPISLTLDEQEAKPYAGHVPHAL